uniref:DUF1977 domain-containing protein n=1 Tax=Periophthalmus magnuspinnatus TaxID=409849 RepID=A0A3B3ZJL9_9GOBI
MFFGGGYPTMIDRFPLPLCPRARHFTNRTVPYFVGEHFSKEWSGGHLKNLERSVEEDYISNLRNNCWKEKLQKEGMLYRARYFGDSDLYERAQRARTPSCAKLSEISASIH